MGETITGPDHKEEDHQDGETSQPEVHKQEVPESRHTVQEDCCPMIPVAYLTGETAMGDMSQGRHRRAAIGRLLCGHPLLPAMDQSHYRGVSKSVQNCCFLWQRAEAEAQLTAGRASETKPLHTSTAGCEQLLSPVFPRLPQISQHCVAHCIHTHNMYSEREFKQPLHCPSVTGMLSNTDCYQFNLLLLAEPTRTYREKYSNRDLAWGIHQRLENASW